MAYEWLYMGWMKMLILFFGAIILAGGFTFFPGRFLHGLFFGS